MEKLKTFLTVNKKTVILIVAIIALIFGGFQIYQKFFSKPSGLVMEVDLPFDAEGPYGLTFPRRDGNAMVLNLKRTSSYDSISFELAYTSTPDQTVTNGSKVTSEEGGNSTGSIDRGVVGNIDTNGKKGEYEQEILFGTCSKNVCKYDKGVENGTLTLHIKKGSTAYRMSTQWHLQKPDIALGILTSGDNHFTYKVDTDRAGLTNIGYSIINDLTGVPKLPNGKSVLGKVYALNVPIAKDMKGGAISFELVDNPPSDAKLYRYNDSENKWEELETKVDGSKLSSKASGAGIFAVLINKK